MAETEKTILLVEDEALIAMSERMMLEKNGYRVVVEHSGDAAIETALSIDRLDLILMDIDLGRGIDGTTAAETILRDRFVPIVFLSSHTEPSVVEKTEGITSYGYIVKNSGDTVLLASIRMAFRLYEANRSIAQKNMQLEVANEQLQITNEALSESNRQLEWWEGIVRFVVEHDPSAIAILDEELRFLYVSRRFLDDYRVAEDDIIGRHHYDVFPHLPGRLREVHQRALGGEVIRSEEDQFFYPDGSVDDTRWECRPWYQLDGRVGGIILYTEVITPRKNVERALRGERERLRVTLKSIGDAVIATDVEGRINLINDVAVRLTGWSESAALGRELNEVFQIIDGTHREPTKNPVDQVLATGKTVGLANHTVLLSADGTEYQIADSAAPIVDESGETIGVVLVFRDVTDEYAREKNTVYGTIQDVTERKRLENDLRERNRRYDAILSSVYDVVFTLDRDGRHTDVYGRILEEWGMTADDFIGRTASEILGAAAAKPHDEAFRQAIGGKTATYEWSVPTDGGAVRFQTALTPFVDRECGGPPLDDDPTGSEASTIIAVVGVGRRLP